MFISKSEALNDIKGRTHIKTRNKFPREKLIFNWIFNCAVSLPSLPERGLSLQVIGGQITCGIRHEKFALGILRDIMFSSEYITR